MVGAVGGGEGVATTPGPQGSLLDSIVGEPRWDEAQGTLIAAWSRKCSPEREKDPAPGRWWPERPGEEPRPAPTTEGAAKAGSRGPLGAFWKGWTCARPSRSTFPPSSCRKDPKRTAPTVRPVLTVPQALARWVIFWHYFTFYSDLGG